VREDFAKDGEPYGWPDQIAAAIRAA